ncbi:MAG: endolytic transglycosylase MltG [Anaerolineae bacterium]
MDIIKTLFKWILVVVTIAIVGFGIYLGYQFAFPPNQKSAGLDLPALDLTQCSPADNSGFDPTDLYYAYQLQQAQDKLAKPASTDNKETTFSVESGEAPADVAVRLKRDGYITDSDVFIILLKCRHASEKIQAGDHILRRNMSMDEIALALQRGTQRGVTIIIRPGWRAEQIADYLATLNLPQFNRDEFLRLVKQGNFDYDFLQDRPKGASSSVEGFLYPETYNVLQGITPEQLINRFLSEFGKRITPDMRKKASDENLTLYEVVSLAAIVEREAVLQDEAPVIASVYMNRIKKKMLLNADPTVQYALGYDAKNKQWWQVVSLQEYGKVNSPYNTYLFTGLPPGPICEPSLNSIQGALEPATTDYFYFLAKGDGGHVFARTLEEQNANMVKYGYQAAPTPKKP